MTWIFVAAAVVLALVVVVSAAALVEVFRQLTELREVMNITDEPTPLNLKSGELRTDQIGLPPALLSEPEAIVVFLSLKCSTCLAVAEAFEGGSPATVWFVVQASPPSVLTELLARSSERVILDEDDEITNALGLNVTPAVLTTSFGEITRARGISSARQLLRLVPTPLPRQKSGSGTLVAS